MTSQPKNVTGTFAIYIIVGLMGLTGTLLLFQSKSITNLKPPIRAHWKDPSIEHTEPNSNDASTGKSKSETFFQTLRDSLKQTRSFPYQPVWSRQTYDPNRELDATYQEQLKRHVMLREFYSSEVRLSQEFQNLYSLLKQREFNLDTVEIMKLFDTIRIIEISIETMDEDPKLTHPLIRESLEKMYANELNSFHDIMRSMLGFDDPDFVAALLEIHPKDGFGTPDTNIKPGEPLLIR